jgi:peptide/nickel transport system substrate-binding protein
MKKISSYIVVLLSILTIACEPQHNNSISKNQTFSYNEAAGITSLDPAFSRTFENLWAVNQVFEGLVELDDDLNVVPLIAKHWDISEDGKTYTFYLRDDVFFHETDDFKKRKVNADDFVYSFKRIIDPETASPGKWVFNKVATHGFIAPDKQTFVIKLKEAFPPFLGILTMKYCSVVPKEAIQKYGEEFRAHPVGTGPFVFHFWEENQMLSFLKNQDYFLKDEHNTKLPYLEAVSVTFKKDLNAVFLEFLKGNYDILQGTEGEYLTELLDSEGSLRPIYEDDIVLDKSSWLKTDYLGFLVDPDLPGENPFLDVRVRMAINLAINRELLTSVLLHNMATPAFGGFLPEGLPAHQPDYDAFRYDQAKAARLIIEAGYGLDNQLKIELNTTAPNANMAQFIQHQLALVGIDLKVNILEAGNLNEYVANSKILFFKKSWLADYPDEENFMALFYSENFCPDGPNYTHFKNREFDRLYEAALSVNDRDKRADYYRAMDSIISINVPVVPLYYGQAIRFLQKDVSGLPSNAINILDLRRVMKVGE